MVSPADEVVLDASVAAKWYLTDEQFVAEGRVLFNRLLLLLLGLCHRRYFAR
jgi:hypothetical protein